MESERNRFWLWIVVAIIAFSAYLFATQPTPVTEPKETGGRTEPVSRPPEPLVMPQRSLQDREALSPATGIADDATEAVRRMNEEAQKMMDSPEQSDE